MKFITIMLVMLFIISGYACSDKQLEAPTKKENKAISASVNKSQKKISRKIDLRSKLKIKENKTIMLIL